MRLNLNREIGVPAVPGARGGPTESESPGSRRAGPAWRIALLLLALGVGLAAGAGPAGMWSGRAWAGERLVVYSGRGERFTRPIVQAFQERTGIETISLVGSSGQLLMRIEEEGARTEADIYLTNYVGFLEKARERGLLQPYRSPHAASVPAAYRGPDDFWSGASARVRAIVYNTGLADPSELRTMSDLADPRWEDKLGLIVSSNASFIGGLSTMILQEGVEATRAFLRGIKRNAGDRIYPKHTPLVSAVARGEVAVGLINHYYYYRAMAKNPALPLGLIYPGQESHGAPVTIAGLGILKHAKHLEAARKFVDFVLSPEGQKLFAEVNYEFPVSREVPAHPSLPAPGTVRLSPVSQSLQVESIDRAIELIKEVGLQ